MHIILQRVAVKEIIICDDMWHLIGNLLVFHIYFLWALMFHKLVTAIGILQKNQIQGTYETMHVFHLTSGLA